MECEDLTEGNLGKKSLWKCSLSRSLSQTDFSQFPMHFYPHTVIFSYFIHWNFHSNVMSIKISLIYANECVTHQVCFLDYPYNFLSLSLDIFEHIHTFILTQHPSTSWSIFNQGQTTTDLFPSIFSLTHFLYFYLFHIREKFFM